MISYGDLSNADYSTASNAFLLPGTILKTLNLPIEAGVPVAPFPQGLNISNGGAGLAGQFPIHGNAVVLERNNGIFPL
jgi:hypothetical protein